MKIDPGEFIVLILREPREKIWGILQEITPAGVYARGLDLNAFDEFIRSYQSGEHFYGFSNMFFPLWRVERISLDERDGDIPSLAEQFEARTNISRDQI
jgi:hypothetical protein